MADFAVIVKRKIVTYQRIAFTLEADNFKLAEDMALDLAKYRYKDRSHWAKLPGSEDEFFIESSWEQGLLSTSPATPDDEEQTFLREHGHPLPHE